MGLPPEKKEGKKSEMTNGENFTIDGVIMLPEARWTEVIILEAKVCRKLFGK